MDQRAAGALLALAACFACTVAAPTAGNHTALDLYEGASDGCYYNFQHYGEGDRIMTNEPCLNCTCHNRMLMCYLRVCPFTKPIGQDCTVEKRADQCCPIVTCPDVPVDLLTSTSTSSPAEYGATGLGKLDKYGCSINGKYFPEGSKVPPTPNKPCEHCYCIRNMTTCVMQECTLHVDGCTPIYHKDVCCPIRYSCDHPEDEVPLLDDMSTTVRPTPGFLLTTTTLSPVTQMSQDCVHNDQIIADGALITTEKACEHCYCMKGDIVCVVQECGAPMENEGKNCTSLPPREGQCCPDTYICEGDDLNTDIPDESTTVSLLDKQTTLSPPRRSGVEGSGYRIEPNESAYTTIPSTEPELEGSGEELEPTKPTEEHEILTSAKPLDIEEITEDGEQYIPIVTTKAPVYEETSTKEIDNDYKSQTHSTQDILKEDIGDTSMGVSENVPVKHVTSAITSVPESYDKYTTESIESHNTVPDVSPEKEQEMLPENTPSVTDMPTSEEVKPTVPKKSEADNDMDATLNPIAEFNSTPESYTPHPEIVDNHDERATDKTVVISEQVTQKEISEPESDIGVTTSTYATSDGLETVTVYMKEKETSKTEQSILSTTNTPLAESEKLTTELNLAQNTVISGEDESEHSLIIPEKSEKTTESDIDSTEKSPKENTLKPEERVTTVASVIVESESTAEPDKGLNTIPSDTQEQSTSQPSLTEITISSIETRTTESTDIIDIEKSPITTSASTLLPEVHITKADQHTITTEPSFRKEDEVIVSTEKTKQEFGPTTIKTEFVDEGFIPTLTHDEKLSTGPDVPSTDEDITTIVPEYEKESEQTLSQKQPTTESIQEPSFSSVALPEKVTETDSQPEGTSLPTIEITTHASALMPEIDTHEEPSRIPGEGDCLLNGVTYRNNTIVPSTNNCQTGCKCISSIIKCDPIICSPPPDYMSNCQSIYDTPDSCCPTYICDHPRETIPPQSDNQMSGTEPPVISPTIECRGDQCELTETTKPTGPSELCTSGDCLSATSDKTGNECGPDGCGDFVKEPVSLKPSDEQQGCTDGKCESSKEDCNDGKCQLLPTGSEQPSIKPCNGEDCGVKDKEINKIEIPATQSATDISCGSNGCDSSVVTPPHKNNQEICNEKDGCKSEDITTSDCNGDKPCRRKDSSITEQLPSKCEGVECVQQTDTSLEEDMSKLSTASSTSDKTQMNEVTEKISTVNEEKISESTDSPVFDHKTPTSTLIAQYTTEQAEKILDEEKEIPTEESNLIEKEGTKNPNDMETYTDILNANEVVTTLKPNIIQNAEENQATSTPEFINLDHTDKPSSVKEEKTQQPDFNDKDETTKKAYIDEEVTNIPDLTEEYTPKSTDVSKAVTEIFYKSTVSEEPITKTPDITKEYSDRSTQIPDIVKDYNEQTLLDSTTKTQNITGEPTEESIYTDDVTKTGITEPTDIPYLTKEHETKMPDDVEKEPGHKVTPIEEESTSMLDVTKEYSDNLTEKPYEVTLTTELSPNIIENQTAEKIPITEKAPGAPDHIIENTDKPSSLADQNTEKPYTAEKQDDDKISPGEEETLKDTEAPEIIKDHTDRAPTTEEYYTKAPDGSATQSYVPVFITEEGTETPDYRIDHSDKPTLVEKDDTKLSDTAEKETEDELTPVKEVSTETPQIIEDLTRDETTKVPETIKDQTDETTNSPNVVEEQTDKSSEALESDIKTPDIKEEHTLVPVFINKETTETPHYVGEDLYQTSSPEEHDITMPHDHVLPKDEKEKPILVEEELPEKSTDVKEPTEKETEFIEKEGTTEPTITEESGTESMEVIEDISKKPMLIDEASPDDIEGNTNELPFVTEETSTDKSKVKEDVAKDTPLDAEKATEVPNIGKEDDTSASLEPEHTDRPVIFEVHKNDADSKITETHEPQIPGEDKSGTKAPETYVTESEKEIKLPESLMQEHTKSTGEASTPAYESQTAGTEETSKPHSVTGDMSVTEKISKSPDAQGQESPLTGSQEAVTKQEETTQQPLGEGDQTTYHPSKHTTSENEAAEMPEIVMTTQSVEKATKPTEHDFIQEQEEDSTGVPKQEPLPSTTQAPSDEIIKPHKGAQPGSPDVTGTKNTSQEEETTTKAVEEENIKSSIPESHVTLGYEDAYTILEVDKVTGAVDTETQTGELKPHEGELESTSTKVPIADSNDDVIKNQPDIYTPEKEEMITSSIDTIVTTAPFKGFTETDDTPIISEEHISTKYNDETTERLEQPTTKQIDVSSEILISSSKTTMVTEEYHTESHAGYTETPISIETKPSESYELPTTPTSAEISQETSDSTKPISEDPHRRTEITDLEKTTPATSEAGDTAIYEHKTTKIPDSYSPVHSDLSTVEPQLYITSESTATESLELASVAPEQTKTTEPPYSEPESVDIQKTTTISELSEKPSADNLTPSEEPEVQKSSTELPATFMQIHTSSPTQTTTVAPLSLITEIDIGVASEKHDGTETITEPVSDTEAEKVKEEVTTSLHELTPTETMEVTESPVKATAQVEISETTPYLIELEEHTHKIIDDISTVSSSIEKEPTYETEVGISTPSPKDEHIDVQEVMTPLPFEEEHTSKIQEPLSTVSTVEDYTQKVPEDTSSGPALVSEVTTESEMHGVEKVTEKIPGEISETATKQSERPSSSSEESSTISERVTYPTTLSETKETDAEAKPAAEQETGAPAIGEGGGVPQKDITTSKEEFEYTTPTIVSDTPQELPVSESDNKVPTDEEYSHPHITTADESVFSTTKATTIKQEELLTPSPEDKYSTPEEKPTSEAVSSSSTAEVPKPPTEMEPTDEIPAPEDDGLSSGVSGYGEPDYGEEDQAFGPGTCRYGGKVYVSAQQIPRDDPCDFCFCFRSDIICLQQSCPPPIHGCHEEPIQGFCCPRYECPVSMATTVNVTTTTTTTTTTLPPHFPTHGYKGAAQRRGCQIKGHIYKVGEVVRSSSGPCLHCTCGGDGQMKCDPKACTPEPMLRQMIAAAVSAKRRR